MFFKFKLTNRNSGKYLEVQVLPGLGNAFFKASRSSRGVGHAQGIPNRGGDSSVCCGGNGGMMPKGNKRQAVQA